jgi:hypothetical protein
VFRPRDGARVAFVLVVAAAVAGVEAALTVAPVV